MHTELPARLKAAGRTQAWLADMTGTNPTRMTRYIQGKVTDKRMRTRIEKTLREHGISTTKLWGPYEEGFEPTLPPPPQPRPKKPKTQQKPKKAPTPSTEPEAPMFLTRDFLDARDLSHFGLQADPFDDADVLTEPWMGPRQKFVEAQLKRAIRTRDMLCIVGEVGSGKSTLMRRFFAATQGDAKLQVINPATIDRKTLSAFSLSGAILRALAPAERISPNSEERAARVNELLNERITTGVTPVLVIEEAHDLSIEALIALKELWDSGTLYRLLAIVLLGHGRTPWAATADNVRAIDVKLRDPRVRELAQRMRVVRLEAFSREELVEYVGWRLARAEATPALIEASAYDELMSRPALLYPLAVGNVFTAALKLARTIGDKSITKAHVAKVGGKV